jgi:hypothetical protein
MPMTMNTMKRLSGACVIALAFMQVPVRGAELFYMDHDLLTSQFVGPVGPLVISGDIDPGDYDRLLTKIAADDNRFLRQNTVILASNGGDAGEAIKIARFVSSLFAKVSVGPQTGPCVGACFLIYAAAAQRATDGEHLLGMHRPALAGSPASPTAADALEDGLLARERAFLMANTVPNDLLEAMFRHSATEVYWLSSHDEQALGDKSPAFRRFLTQKCAWSDSLERDVYAGKKPFKDLTAVLACRDRLTLPAARRALAAALAEKSTRDRGGTPAAH